MSTNAVAVWRYDEAAAWRWDAHEHREHQLLWGPTGTVSVEIDARNWRVPPTLGLWIPGGTPHAVDGQRPAQVFCLYFDPDRCPVRWVEPTAVAVGSLLREVIVRLDNPTLLEAPRRRIEAVLFDELRPLGSDGLHVPIPSDGRLRQITEALLDDPADDRGLLEWGEEVGASVRTLTRLFLAETGLTFAQWRLQVRLRAALARGASVAEVARLVGYRNASSFVYAFHRLTGRTPTTYFRADQH